MSKLYRALTILTMCGCSSLAVVSQDDVAKVANGQSPSEVQEILGRPDTIAHTAQGSSWVYTLGAGFEEREVRVDFSEGKVVRILDFGPTHQESGREPASEGEVANVVEGDVQDGECLNPWSIMNEHQATCRP